MLWLLAKYLFKGDYGELKEFIGQKIAFYKVTFRCIKESEIKDIVAWKCF